MGSLPLLNELSRVFLNHKNLSEIERHPEFSKVRTLNLSNISEVNFETLATWPNLTELQISVSQLSQLDLSAFEKIRTLRLRDCSHLTELKLPPNLLELYVSSCAKLDFASSRPLPYLQRLDLQFCDAVTSLAGLGSCPELTDLLLFHCNALQSTAGLEKQAKRCFIQSCGSVSDQSR